MRQAVGTAAERVKLTNMLANGSVIGGRFRVARMSGPPTGSIAVAVAEDVLNLEPHWLIQFAVTASEGQLQQALDRHARFALGVPGLARPVASGVEAGSAFLAFRAAASGSVADAHSAAWPVLRVAALATRLAAALAPLHDQGIAFGCWMPALVAEGDSGGDVLFGFGVAALATAFAAAGEASQLMPAAYRAPELHDALSAPTPASDLFALATLLRALCSPPLSSEIQADALHDSRRTEAPRAALSAELHALLTRAEAPDPRTRPQDVSLFAQEFARRSLTPAAPTPAPAPAPALAPVPASAPSLDKPAPAPAPAPPSGAPAANRSLFALFAVIAGVLLMLGGVTAAFAYAVHHAAGVPASPAPSPHPTLPPSPPSASSNGDDPPPVAPAPEAEVEPKLRSFSRSHAPIVAPGVGPSSFPEDAHSALPVLGSEPIWGTRSAALTWVFFGDLDCPHTRRAWRALEAVKASFGDDLRIVFRHRPLREHPAALEAARVLAGLARQKGAQAFFDVLHRVAQSDASMTAEQLTVQLGLAGYGELQLAQLASEGAPAVANDLQLAGQFAVKSTPFSFLNGISIDGERSALELSELLSDEQRSATWLSAAGVPARALYATRTGSNLTGVGAPAEPRVCAPIGTSPVRGPADALVTLVEFSDFECPFCKRAEPTLRALLARYPSTLRLVWKDFPLAQHTNAGLLANFAADAHTRASNLGFWLVHDGLLAQTDIDDSVLGAIAGKAGLDGALLLTSARARLHDAAIRADMKLGERLSVNGTPTFFVNGRRVQGAWAIEPFDALIQEELRAAKRIVAGGVPARDVYRLVCD
jgi:protein-disulfide isomerase